MALNFPGINCYCNFCGSLLRFQIARAGETVNCFSCTMETVLFIPGLDAPYPSHQYTLETRDIRWSSNQFGLRHVAGTVENKSSKHLDWVRVEFILYSQTGLPIGSTSDCLIDVPPARLWNFQAPVGQSEALHVSDPLLACEYGRVRRPEAMGVAKDKALLAATQAAKAIRNP